MSRPAGEYLRSDLIGRFVNEASRLLVIGDQRFNFAAQRLIACAGFVEEGRPLAALALQGGVEDLRDLSPSFGSHNGSD